MSQAPTPDSSWKSLPSWLLFAVLVFGLPTAFNAFTHMMTQNPILFWLIVAGYEVYLFVQRFTGKIWEQLEGPLSKDVVNWLTVRIQEMTSHSHRRYCQYLVNEHKVFNVNRLRTRPADDLELDQVFVNLRMRRRPAHQVSADPVRPPASLQGSHSIWEYLSSSSSANRHLVILGAAGSGKTTLLKHLALTLVQPEKYPQHRLPGHPTPILLLIRDHVQAILDISDQSDFPLEQAVQNQIRKDWQPLSITWISRRLKKGACIVLLDGLEEIGDQTKREKVVEWVQRQINIYGRNRFILTSRPYGYLENPLNGVTVLEVQGFTVEKIKKFVQSWYLANELRSEGRNSQEIQLCAREGAQDLLRRLQRAPALLALAVNPLLLTMIANVHRYRSSLPGKRVDLYAEICEVFLGKQQKAPGIEQELSSVQKQQVLQPLAYFLMQQGTQNISYIEAQRVIEPTLALVNSQMKPEDFLKLIENTSGLFLKQKPDSYAFVHPTFQEYLAAVHIKTKGLEQILVAQVANSWWHETIRLYCAQSDATMLIQGCLAGNQQNIAALTLTFECDDEKLEIEPQTQAQINAVLEAGREDPDLERRQVFVEVLLNRRLHQMVRLQHETYIDTSLITCAEYQMFLDEKRKQSEYYQPDHWENTSFTAGSGKLPVLGVRPSDAQAFCQWLTARDKEEWQYRLPRAEEWPLEERMRKSKLDAETGYWVEDEPFFVWSQGKPSSNLQQQFSLARAQAFDLGPDLARIPARDRGLVHARADTLARARAHADTLAFALNLDLARADSLSRNDTRILADILARDCVRARTLVLDGTLNLTLIRSHTRDLAHALNLERTLVRDLKSYYMLKLFEERIAGNLPACEGILLVKEWKAETEQDKEVL